MVILYICFGSGGDSMTSLYFCDISDRLHVPRSIVTQNLVMPIASLVTTMLNCRTCVPSWRKDLWIGVIYSLLLPKLRQKYRKLALLALGALFKVHHYGETPFMHHTVMGWYEHESLKIYVFKKFSIYKCFTHYIFRYGPPSHSLRYLI